MQITVNNKQSCKISIFQIKKQKHGKRIDMEEQTFGEKKKAEQANFGSKSNKNEIRKMVMQSIDLQPKAIYSLFIWYMRICHMVCQWHIYKLNFLCILSKCSSIFIICNPIGYVFFPSHHLFVSYIRNECVLCAPAKSNRSEEKKDKFNRRL